MGGFCWTVHGLDSSQTHLQGQAQLGEGWGSGVGANGGEAGTAGEEGAESGPEELNVSK